MSLPDGPSEFDVQGSEVLANVTGDFRGGENRREPSTWLVNGQADPMLLPRQLTDAALKDIRYADVDADGDHDVIALEYPRYSPNFATPSLVWLENVDGSYEASQVIERRVVSFDLLQTTEHPFQVVAARTDRTSILEFQEHGFRETTQLTRYDSHVVTGGPWFVDLDGDEIDDMVSVWASGAVIAWHKGLGDGVYLSPTPVIRGLRYYEHPAMPFHDIDQDGDLDFVSGDGYWYENEWPIFLPRLITEIDQRSSLLATADFNGDGLIDVITSQALVISQGSGQFEEFEHELRRISSRVMVSDMDGDGDLDLWTPQSSNWFENVALQFVPRTLPQRVRYVVDVDGDGVNELLAVGDNETIVFVPSSDRTWTLPVIGEPVDLNQDGHVDFLSTDVCMNQGDDTFACERDVLPEGNKQVVDFDGDGMLDIVSSNSDYGVQVLQRTVAIPSADFDKDGTVAFGDFLILTSEFGREQEDAEWRSDLDGSGKVDFLDFLIFAEQFGD